MSKKYDYNKSDIANIAEEFKALLVEHDCADDVCIYYFVIVLTGFLEL